MKKYILAGVLSFLIIFLSFAAFGAQAAAVPEVPLNITKLVFADDVAGLGQYTPKQGERFVTGDICTIYIETTGFVLAPKPDTEDEFDLDLSVDLEIRTPRGRRPIVSEQNFASLKTTIRSQFPATFLAFGFRFDEQWDYGDYVMSLTLRDNLSGQAVTQEKAYLLEEPTEEDLARQAEDKTADR